MEDDMIYIYEKTVCVDGIEYTELLAHREKIFVILPILDDKTLSIKVHAYCEEEGVGVNVTEDFLEAAYDRWCLEDDFGENLLPVFKNSERIRQLHTESIKAIPAIKGFNVIQLNEWKKQA